MKRSSIGNMGGLFIHWDHVRALSVPWIFSPLFPLAHPDVRNVFAGLHYADYLVLMFPQADAVHGTTIGRVVRLGRLL